MPMRAYRASRDAVQTSAGGAGAHVAGNKLAWMAACAVVAVVATYLNWSAEGRGSIWGHVAAFAGMLLGILIMMKAEEGNAPPDPGPDED
jgi:nitrous oxidase accessory protein NosD